MDSKDAQSPIQVRVFYLQYDYRYNIHQVLRYNKLHLMPLVEYSQNRKCNHDQLPFTNTIEIQDHFSINDVNLKVRKYSRATYSMNTILNAINKNQTKNWFGFQLFNDYNFQPAEQGPDWRYYFCKFKRTKQVTQLSKMHSITIVLNFMRTVLPLISRSMAIYTEDFGSDIIMRPLVHVQLTSTNLKECLNNQIIPKGFSKIIHYRVIQKEEELVIMVGYTQSYLQCVYLTLQFRQLNCKRLNLNHEISLETLDYVVQHLIQIMRKMAQTNDFNLYGKGIKAVFQTYLLEGRFINVDRIKQRLEEHRRLLLLYECQYAKVSVYNTTLMGRLQDLVLKKQLLYSYLSTVLLNSQGLTINDDLSYCCFMQQNPQSQEIITIIAVEKKTLAVSGLIPIQTIVKTSIDSLIKYLEIYPEFSNSLNRKVDHQIEGPMSHIKPNFKYLQINKNTMLSRIKKQQDELVPFFPKITSNHFFKEYQRLQSIFVEHRENAEYVQNLIFQIMKLHKKKMLRYLPAPTKSPQKKISSSKNTSIISSLPNSIFRLGLAKSIKSITENSYTMLNFLDRPGAQNQIVSVLVQNNPFISQKSLCSIVELICHKHLRTNYSAFLNRNSLQPVRDSILYKFLSAVSRSYDSKSDLNIQELNIDEELLELIEPKSQKSQSDAYFSMLSKIVTQIFKQNSCRILNMLFKIIEQFLLRISIQPTIYVMLGGIYIEVVMGGIGQSSRMKPINNSPYKTNNLSQLTSHIKKDKILQFVINKGVQAEMNKIQKFFESLKKIEPNRSSYEVYRDFIYSNYDLLTFIEEVYSPPTSIDLNIIHKFFTENQFRLKISPKGNTIFSLFHEDIESYNLPVTEEDVYLNKSHLFNKTLSTSNFVKDLYQRNPDTKLAGVAVKEVFGEVKDTEVDLYDRNQVALKVYGIGLLEAQEHFNLFVNLDNKYKNYERLSDDERSFFNETVQRVLTRESKLRTYIQKTLDLEVYLRKLQRE